MKNNQKSYTVRTYVDENAEFYARVNNIDERRARRELRLLLNCFLENRRVGEEFLCLNGSNMYRKISQDKFIELP